MQLRDLLFGGTLAVGIDVLQVPEQIHIEIACRRKAIRRQRQYIGIGRLNDESARHDYQFGFSLLKRCRAEQRAQNGMFINPGTPRSASVISLLSKPAIMMLPPLGSSTVDVARRTMKLGSDDIAERDRIGEVSGADFGGDLEADMATDRARPAGTSATRRTA